MHSIHQTIHTQPQTQNDKIESNANNWNSLPKELVLEIFRRVSIRDQISLTKTCKRFLNIHHSDVRLITLAKIGKSFNSPPKLTEADYWIETCHYNPMREEISLVRRLWHYDIHTVRVTVYRKDFKIIDLLQLDIFDNSIVYLSSTSTGNLVIGSEKAENKIVYWNREKKTLQVLKTYSYIDLLKNVEIFHVQEKDRFYFGTKGHIDAFQEIDNEMKCINEISLPPLAVVWLQEDEKNSTLWIINKKKNSLKQMIELNLNTKKYSTYDCPFSFGVPIFYDKTNNWLIGQTEGNCFAIWDTVKKTVVQEIAIPLDEIHVKWDKDLGSVDSAHYDQQTKQLFFVYKDKRRIQSTLSVKRISKKLMIWDISNQNLYSPNIEKLIAKNFNRAIHRKENEDYLFNFFIVQIDYDPISNVVILNGDAAWDLTSGLLIKGHSSDERLGFADFYWDKSTHRTVSLQNQAKVIIKIYSPDNYLPKVKRLRDRIIQKVKRAIGYIKQG